jgi:multisubunit Na+/H+ antiporter MnhC subunit
VHGVTNVRLACASAAVLSLVGVFFLVRADERVQTILGLALLLSAVAVAIGAWNAEKQRRR